MSMLLLLKCLPVLCDVLLTMQFLSLNDTGGNSDSSEDDTDYRHMYNYLPAEEQQAGGKQQVGPGLIEAGCAWHTCIQ